MASGSPPAPVKVPSTATSYTPATLDPDLRSQINSILIREGYASKIQSQLIHALHAHPTNWPTAVQTHAMSLLHSGEATTFTALLQRVLDDVRHDSAAASQQQPAANSDAEGASAAEGTSGALAVPRAVVEEALRATRESLETICDIDGDGAT